MEIFKLCITVFIYLIFPVAGITAYVLLLKKMRREQVPHIPKLSLLALFYIYGSWLVIILAEIFVKWSGMASMGVAFLIVIAPFICGIIAFRHRKNILLTKYHRLVFLLSIVYLISIAFLLGSVVVHNLMLQKYY